MFLLWNFPVLWIQTLPMHKWTGFFYLLKFFPNHFWLGFNSEYNKLSSRGSIPNKHQLIYFNNKRKTDGMRFPKREMPKRSEQFVLLIPKMDLGRGTLISRQSRIRKKKKKKSSNSGLVSCIHFPTNPLGKDINPHLFFLPPIRG